MGKEKIVIIEDEHDIAELVQYNLQKEGYQVFSALDAEKGFDLVKKEYPHLIILDLMLPGIDGLELCKMLKQDEKMKRIPIIMLTAKSEESDMIVGLQMGADDYVTKPFSPKILVARVKTLLRRVAERQKPQDVRQFDDLVIDIPKHKVLYKDKKIDLTMIEFNILEFLSRYPGRVFSRDQIMDGAWSEGRFVVDRAVDVHVRALRKKLGKAADCIETIRGVGYSFKEIE